MKKHKYIIEFNKKTDKSAVCTKYDFGRVMDITISIGNQCAAVVFECGVLREVEDFITFKDKTFRDAYRKILLIHAITQNKGMKVKKITIIIDGAKNVINGDNDPTGHFPYMSSMIGVNELRLCDSWQNLTEEIAHTTKSKLEDDYRFAAMYSYLMSKNREYLIDRFSNLWTAMNAYYSYVATMYEETLMHKYKLQSLPGGLKLTGKDADSMGAVVWLLGKSYPMLGEEDVREKILSLWKNNYEVENCLNEFSNDDIKELYNSSLNALNGIEMPQKYGALQKRAHEFEVMLYPFLLIEYPYNWRCKYFHGNRISALIAAYNDYEISVLYTVNYFLDQFLNEAIPQMFASDFWTDKKQDMTEEYMRRIRTSKGKDKFQNALDKAISDRKNNDN